MHAASICLRFDRRVIIEAVSGGLLGVLPTRASRLTDASLRGVPCVARGGTHLEPPQPGKLFIAVYEYINY